MVVMNFATMFYFTSIYSDSAQVMVYLWARNMKIIQKVYENFY